MPRSTCSLAWFLIELFCRFILSRSSIDLLGFLGRLATAVALWLCGEGVLKTRTHASWPISGVFVPRSAWKCAETTRGERAC